MSCWSRYARFSGVSFVLVRYMSATLFMSCSIWLYLSLISVNLPDASPESWWMSMLECLVMNLLSPHIDIREADDAAYPSTNVCTSVSMYLMRSHMYRVGIREPPELVMCIDMGFVVLVSSLSCLAMLSHWMMTSPSLAQFSSVISPTILMLSCEFDTMDGCGIIISEDPRGFLYREFVRFVRLIRPKFILGENVKGLLKRKMTDGRLFVVFLMRMC